MVLLSKLLPIFIWEHISFYCFIDFRLLNIEAYNISNIHYYPIISKNIKSISLEIYHYFRPIQSIPALMIKNLIKFNIWVLKLDYSNKLVHYSCSKNDLVSFIFLLENGADIHNSTEEIITPNCLHYASRFNSLDIVKYLLEVAIYKRKYKLTKFEYINLRDDKGLTPLHYGNRYIEIVKYLLENGAIINIKDNNGKTPLFYGDIWNNYNIELIKLYIDNGENINTKDEFNETRLFYECWKGNLVMINFLIENGAEINIHGEFGLTPLHIACIGNYLEIVKILLAHNANIKALDENSNSPLHSSCIENNLSISILLVTNGANINHKNIDGNTPIHLACLEDHLNTIKYLIDVGSNVNSRNLKNETPLDIAISHNYSNLMKFFIENRSLDLSDININF